MQVLDLFSGCGGASLGFIQANFEIIGAIDIDTYANITYKKNIGLEPLRKNLRKVNNQLLRKYFGLKKAELDVLIGCPPCQSFSYLRRTTKGNSEDPRDDLVMVFLKKISVLKPKAIVFENVSGITIGRGKIFLDRFLSKLNKMGYKYIARVINASDHGVPQFRKRLICIAVHKEILNGKELKFPIKTHTKPDLAVESNLERWKTVRDTIGDLPLLNPGEKADYPPNHLASDHTENVLEIIKNIPKDGGSRKDLPKYLWLPCHRKLEKSKGAESVYGRMWWDQPAPTITSRCTTPSCGRFIHPEQDRGITPREAARLQCFPDDFEFFGSIQSITKQIGNAMPVELMRVIALKLKEILN